MATTGSEKRSESRTVKVYQGGEVVGSYQEHRQVSVQTTVSCGYSSSWPGGEDSVVNDPTKITAAQAGTESDDNRLTSSVAWDPKTGKWTKTNTHVSAAGAWESNSSN